MSVTGTENDVGGFGECLTAEQLVITGWETGIVLSCSMKRILIRTVTLRNLI
jgi:hypothetical protein